MAVKKRLEIDIAKRRPSFAMKGAHTHSWYELFCLQSGSCELTIGDIVWNCQPGAVAIITPDTPHMTKYSGNVACSRVSLEFTSQYIHHISSEPSLANSFNAITNGVFQLFESDVITINHYLNQLFEEKNSPDELSDVVSSCIITELLSLLMRKFEHIPDTGRAKQSDNTIQLALLYIEKNYTQNISLDMLANMFSLNPSYFSKKFKSVVGTGFKEYLTNLRIIHSERLLLETQKSITEIAMLCGFDNSNYYGDSFRKKNRVSPSEFRKKKGFLLE